MFDVFTPRSLLEPSLCLRATKWLPASSSLPFPIFISIRASTADVSAFIPRVFFTASSTIFTSLVPYLITCFHPTVPSRGRPGSPHDLH
jgi:hypothetical protein